MSAKEPMLDPPSYIPDCCDQNGAFRLKLRIEAYWRARGYAVRVRLEHHGYNMRMRSTRVDLRSDMVNGLPTTEAVQDREAA